MKEVLVGVWLVCNALAIASRVQAYIDDKPIHWTNAGVWGDCALDIICGHPK